MIRSPWVAWAIHQRNLAREEYDRWVWAQYLQAEEATRGALLNKRGRKAQVDAVSLFSGHTARAWAYASEELREWWYYHPRMTFESFERQHLRNWLEGSDT